MERCRQCNSTLTREEKECFTCGSVVPDKNPKKTFSDRFRAVVNVLFIIFAILTVGSIFTSYVGSFWKNFAGLLVLYLVRNSAINMFESSKRT